MIRKNNYLKLIITFFLVTCIGATQSSNADRVLIYIHGTKFFGLDKAIAAYKKWRYNDIISQSIIPRGISSQSMMHNEPFAHHFSSLLCKSKYAFVQEKNILFFGWDGSLLPSRRELAAQMLYEELCTFITSRRKTGYPISEIYILTHSHGGNVALNLIHTMEREHASFAIDQLIMMACPIQKMTSSYAYSPMVKKIISIYFENDGVQQNDPQIVYPESFKDGCAPPVRSERILHQRADHIWQIKLSIDGKSYGHQLFTTELVLPHIPLIMHSTKQNPADMYALNIITNGEAPFKHINVSAA